MSTGRKFERVREVLDGLGADLAELRTDAIGTSQEYVRTEDFADLLEQTLRRVGEERSEEKRRIYRAFLKNEIESPGAPFDEQTRLLRAFENLTADQMRVIKAIAVVPSHDHGMMGSPIHTLRRRVPELTEQRIKETVSELNTQGLTDLQTLMVMMTANGAANLTHNVTPFGKRVLAYILAADKTA